MLRGKLVTLRARIEADVPILDRELHDDVEATARSSGSAWRPVSPGRPESGYAITAATDGFAPFSVVTTEDDELVGAAALWGIQMFHRSAHIGISMLPSARGKGLGTDTLRVLCHYGFVVLGCHRLQLETVADNAGMIGAAERAGFTRDGVLREAAWVLGEFVDEHVFGLLARDWRQ